MRRVGVIILDPPWGIVGMDRGMRNWPRRTDHTIRDVEVYLGDIICFVEDHEYDLNNPGLFFGIGRVVEFHPARAFVTVDRFHCSTDSWEEALGLDLDNFAAGRPVTTTTDVHYIEMCPQCCNPNVFRANVLLQDIVMTALEFEGQEVNELHHEEREELAHILGGWDYMEQMLEHSIYDNDYRNDYYSRRTFIFAQSLGPRPRISTQAAATTEAAPMPDDEDMPELISPTFRHMDENCPLLRDQRDQQDER